MVDELEVARRRWASDAGLRAEFGGDRDAWLALCGASTEGRCERSLTPELELPALAEQLQRVQAAVAAVGRDIANLRSALPQTRAPRLSKPTPRSAPRTATRPVAPLPITRTRSVASSPMMAIWGLQLAGAASRG